MLDRFLPNTTAQIYDILIDNMQEIWSMNVHDLHNWFEFENKLRSHFFAEKNVPCESMETAAFKTFRLKSRQAILTDIPIKIAEFLPRGHKVVFSKDKHTAIVTLYGAHIQHFVGEDGRLPLKRSSDD